MYLHILFMCSIPIAEYVVCDYNRMKVQRHTHNIVILLKALLHHDYSKN